MCTSMCLITFLSPILGLPLVFELGYTNLLVQFNKTLRVLTMEEIRVSFFVLHL